MPRFIEGQDRHQVTLLPESLDDFIADDSRTRPTIAIAASHPAGPSARPAVSSLEVCPKPALYPSGSRHRRATRADVEQT